MLYSQLYFPKSPHFFARKIGLKLFLPQSVFTKSTMDTPESPEKRQRHRSCVFIFNFVQTSHIVLVFPLYTLNKKVPTGMARQ